jgi:hypothetical protein
VNRRLAPLMALLVLGGLVLVAGGRPPRAPAPARAAAPPSTSAPAIRHVFVITLENESASVTFGPNSPAPYLSKTLPAQGAFLPNYYAVGHNSLDNYIAMVSGQAPGVQTQQDCQIFSDLLPGNIGANGQAQGSGCVYPAAVPTIASQLTGAGFTWRDYNEQMGTDPAREAGECGHPAVGRPDNTESATATDMYATRHDPFVYFHSIIDDTTLCDSHVVNLDGLPQDLSSAASTANYSFITPDLCSDGHDAPCADGQPGGLAQTDSFLRTWVPKITASPAFRQDGLLIITFDEASTSDQSSCCGEIAGPNSPAPGGIGPGGGDVGTVLLSPCIAPGTVSRTPYNHYTMLGSVENIFGLSHLGYAQLPGETYFGSDIYNRRCGAAPPVATIHAPPLASASSSRAQADLRWGATTAGGSPLASYTVQSRDLSVASSPWRTVGRPTLTTSRVFHGTPGHTYSFRVQALDQAGLTSAPATAITVFPSIARVGGGHFAGRWQLDRRRGAWQGRDIQASTAGSVCTLRYVGGAVRLIGERSPRGGVARVTVDGRTRTIHLHAARLKLRQVIYNARAKRGVHHLRLAIVRGTVALEGFAITARTG